MRALKAVPEIAEKLKSGAMNVTTLSKVQVFLRQEKESGVKRSEDEVKSLFTRFENKTVREVKAGLLELKGESAKRKLILELDPEAETLWLEVKALAAHKTRGDELHSFKLLMREWLEEKKRKREGGGRPKKVTSSLGSIQVAVQQQRVAPQGPEPERSRSQRPPSRAIPITTRRAVFKRDQHKCKNCGSRYAIQIEHRIPYTKSGSHQLENLLLLCRSCNLNQGIKEFGLIAMRR